MIGWRDILAMAAHNLWQRKLRTLLNLLGVVVGCVVLLMTAAGVSGVKNAINVLFDSAESARQVGVLPDLRAKGDPPADYVAVSEDMTEERRERIVDQLENQWRNENRRQGAYELTVDHMNEMAALPHVQSVIPDVHVSCIVTVDSSKQVSDGIAGIDVHSTIAASRVIVGEMLNDTTLDEALVHEFVAYRLGYRSDDALRELVGKTVRVQYQPAVGKSANLFNMLIEKWGQLSPDEFSKQTAFLNALQQLIQDLDSTSLTDEQKQLIRSLIVTEKVAHLKHTTHGPNSREFRIRGIVRDGDDGGLAQLFRGHYQGGFGGIVLHSDVATKIHLETSERESFYDALVTVDSTKNLGEVTEALELSGTRTLSALRILESMDEHIEESAWIVVGVAAAILLTAAIGISNTLLISVLERTPEFGIMKSVGATNSTLLTLMVCEGAMLGFVGAILSILASLFVAFIGHGFLEYYVENRLNAEIATSLFQFTLLPMLGVVVVAVAVCVVASILPAWRAARLDPIVAMRRT